MNAKMTAGENSDAELVSRSLAGDRDAFSRIVVRYQNLICSLAYSRMGNLGQSEDVAQETFITAWRHLRHLREPEKLRAWLCGIVRNRIRKSREREGSEPVCNAATLEEAPESPAVEALPSEQTISREEAAILWRSLERIPDLYREPLVLFYRENQSIAHVAGALEISEDAVKQRLLRGRKLLQEQVQAFVEKTLRQTAPGQAFSSAVLAAMPMAQAAAFGVGAAGKGTAAAKSGFLGAWLIPLAPFIAMLAGFASQWMIIRATAVSPRDRRNRQLHLIVAFIILMGTSVGGTTALGFLAHRFAWNERICFVAWAVFWWLYCMGLATWIIPGLRRIQATREQSPESMAAFRRAMAQLKPITGAFMTAGWHLMVFVGPLFIALRLHDWMAEGIILGLMVPLGVWNFRQGRTQLAMGSGLHLALCCAVILAIVNLRLDVWMAGLASGSAISVAEIHQRFPLWIVPLLTLALVLWAAILLVLTKPRNPLASD